MRKDGICMVKNDYYTKTLQFNDINYELAGDEEQEAIFNRYCRFLNQFESNIDIQFTFQNKVIDLKWTIVNNLDTKRRKELRRK